MSILQLTRWCLPPQSQILKHEPVFPFNLLFTRSLRHEMSQGQPSNNLRANRNKGQELVPKMYPPSFSKEPPRTIHNLGWLFVNQSRKLLRALSGHYLSPRLYQVEALYKVAVYCSLHVNRTFKFILFYLNFFL